MVGKVRMVGKSSQKSFLGVRLTLRAQRATSNSNFKLNLEPNWRGQPHRAAKLWPFRIGRLADIQQPCRDRRQIVYDLHINSTGRIIYLCYICFKETDENLAIVSRNRGAQAGNELFNTHRPHDGQSLCTHLGTSATGNRTAPLVKGAFTLAKHPKAFQTDLKHSLPDNRMAGRPLI